MPIEFHEPLKESDKPFMSLIRSISEFARKNNSKEIPSINLTDYF